MVKIFNKLPAIAGRTVPIRGRRMPWSFLQHKYRLKILSDEINWLRVPRVSVQISHNHLYG